MPDLEVHQTGQAEQEGLVHLVQAEGEPPGPGPRLDLGGRTVGQQTAPVDDQDPVRRLVGLLQVVRGEQERAPRGHLFLHAVPEQPAGLHVHGRGRLVQHDQLGLAADGQREPDPLGLAAGQAVHPLVGELGDAGALERGRDRFRVRVQLGDQLDKLAHRHLGHQPAGLEHGADPPGLNRVVRVLAEHADAPAGGLAQREQHVKRGGFARPVRPEQGDGLARAQVEGQPVNGPQPPVVLGYVLERDH